MNGRRTGRPGPTHPAYRRLAGYCDTYAPPDRPHAPVAAAPPHPPVGPPGPAGPARPAAQCPRCDALRTACYCDAPVAGLRTFARRMAELHPPTGTPVCGCGVYACYVRRRLDAVGREDTVGRRDAGPDRQEGRDLP